MSANPLDPLNAASGLGERSPGTLVIVIVNFRTPDLTIECLRSLAPEISSRPGISAVVVENGSGDDSAARIGAAMRREGWESWCTLEASQVNTGFSGGNNHGISAARRRGKSKYVLLLNSDTIVQAGCLGRSIDAMDADPGIGALTCRVLNVDGSIQNVCRRFPTPLRCLAAALSLPWRFPRLFSWADCEDPDWDRTTSARDVEWIGGAYMMLRGDWIDRHRGLDDRFFFYGEDVEICHRIWRTGFRCRYDPKGATIHLGGASSDPSRITTGTRSFHYWRGRYLLQEICYGKAAKRFVQCVDFLGLAARMVTGRVTRRRSSAEIHTMREVLGFLSANWNKWSTRVD